MKVQVLLTDDQGRVFEGEAELTSASPGAPRQRGARPQAQVRREMRQPGPASLDFSLPERAFVKLHTRGLGGPQKFVVLLARLATGKVGMGIPVKDIRKAWNRMTEPMGGKFNDAYPTRAKDQGWIDCVKTGVYALRRGWDAALGRS